MSMNDDIFTEQDADPDTLANLGPLRRFAGIWESQKGIDISPKAPGPERKTYIERMVMQPIDAQSNGPQLFYGLRYHTHINTPDEDITFHDQVGYWLWEPATGLIIQTLTIPRGQTAIAAGRAAPDDLRLNVRATRGDTEYGICSNGFLEQNFRTDAYELTVDFNDDGSWTYISQTTLMVRGQDKPFTHRDTNRLVRVGDADLNPWLKIVQATGNGKPA